MSIRSGHDERERDATGVHQEMSLAAFFPPIRGVVSHGFPGQGRFGHGPVDRLPVPGDPFHLVVLRESRFPEGQKQTRFFPFSEVAVNRAGTSEELLLLMVWILEFNPSLVALVTGYVI